jgi:hypothetical protein
MSNKEWLSNLKPGDNVAITNHHGGGAKSVHRGVVVTITGKAKKIKVRGVGGETTFSPDGHWSSGYFSKDLEPLEGQLKAIIEADEALVAKFNDKKQSRDQKISQLPAVPASELVRVLDMFQHELDEVSNSLKVRLSSVVRDLDRAKDSIGTDSDFHVNRLGILQTSGLEIERLSVAYHHLKDVVKELTTLVPGVKDL